MPLVLETLALGSEAEASVVAGEQLLRLRGRNDTDLVVLVAVVTRRVVNWVNV